MTVHSFYVFDRKGKTLFSKSYVQDNAASTTRVSPEERKEELSEKRKLVFGMLFSLRELANSLSPVEGGDLKLVRTGAATLYNFETYSGLRFVLYTTPESSYATSPQHSTTSGNANNPATNNNNSSSSSSKALTNRGMTSPKATKAIQDSLKHIFEEIWVTFVVRSPMFQPAKPNVGATNFEACLDSYLKTMPWFR